MFQEWEQDPRLSKDEKGRARSPSPTKGGNSDYENGVGKLFSIFAFPLPMATRCSLISCLSVSLCVSLLYYV
jgi:hypothetical protein